VTENQIRIRRNGITETVKGSKNRVRGLKTQRRGNPDCKGEAVEYGSFRETRGSEVLARGGDGKYLAGAAGTGEDRKEGKKGKTALVTDQAEDNTPFEKREGPERGTGRSSGGGDRGMGGWKS